VVSSKRRSRADWSGGVAHGFAEMQRIDEEWWLALGPAERLELVAELSASFDWSSDVEIDQDEGSVRLLGPLGGVRRRGR
jgi:hypothetical protein